MMSAIPFAQIKEQGGKMVLAGATKDYNQGDAGVPLEEILPWAALAPGLGLSIISCALSIHNRIMGGAIKCTSSIEHGLEFGWLYIIISLIFIVLGVIHFANLMSGNMPLLGGNTNG